MQNLKVAFPDLTFIRLKQVHGDQLIQTTPATPDFQIEADAHYTNSRKTALCSISADCLPILIYSVSNPLIMAIHAGWKGLAARIVPQSLNKIMNEVSRVSDLRFVIGPHIQITSFEVGKDVELKLIQATKKPIPEISHSLNNDKSKVDLKKLLLCQLSEFSVSAEQIYYQEIDTFSNTEFHSARRDKEHSGRQISFISII